MKKEILVQRINNDMYMEEILLMHRDIFKETKLSGKLIYFDEAFNKYFKTLLKDDKHYIFGVFFNNKIYGFVHLRRIAEVLFLNNIFLDEFIRGNGTGTRVLYEILNIPCITEEDFKSLELDVLESNIKAKSWYQRLGLFQKSIQHWCVVKKEHLIDNTNLKLAYDLKNFKGLFLESTKVATVIGDSCIIVHDLKALDYICNLPFIMKLDKIPEGKNIEFSKFESSIRMTGSISYILKNLQNV